MRNTEAPTDWEVVYYADSKSDLPQVRRFPCPGGWLYQVSQARIVRESIVDGVRHEAVTLAWHAPVFVADEYDPYAVPKASDTKPPAPTNLPPKRGL